jgi:hypothetical protein
MANKSAHPEALKMRIARRRAEEYGNLIRESEEACDCQGCETCMKVGIQVFDWILDADQGFRRDVYEGKYPYDADMEDALEELMRHWYKLSAGAIKWAEKHISLGFDVAYFAEFKQRVEEASAMVEAFDDNGGQRTVSEPLILLRDQALEEHRNGQTAEFF